MQYRKWTIKTVKVALQYSPVLNAVHYHTQYKSCAVQKPYVCVMLQCRLSPYMTVKVHLQCSHQHHCSVAKKLHYKHWSQSYTTVCVSTFDRRRRLCSAIHSLQYRARCNTLSCNTLHAILCMQYTACQYTGFALRPQCDVNDNLPGQ